MPEIASASLPRFNVTTDDLDEKQVTFDYSQMNALSIITQEQLMGSPIKSAVNGYSIVGAQITSEGSPGNALMDGAHPLSVGVNHWRFVGVPQSIGAFGCGISSTTGYGSGWGLKAFYLTSNGNIAGRGALKVGYVSNMPSLPVVDWVIEVSESNVVDTYIYVNGDFKGHAGHLQFPDTDSVKALRPVVTFDDSSENCKVVFVDHEVMPADQSAPYKHMPESSSIYDCTWKLVDTDLEVPDAGIHLTLMPDGLSVKVANSMRIGGKVSEDGSIHVSGPVTSTMMMAPMFEAAETKMKSMLESASGWSWDKKTLTISAGSDTYKWTVYRDEPVTENPLVPDSF